MVHIERDNKVIEMQRSVFNQLNDIVRAIDPTPQKTNAHNNVAQVSVEDAIKELLDMGVEV